MNDRNDWQIVQNAPPPYAKCAITGFGDGPFVDFGVRLNAIDPNVVINVDVLKDAARFVGMYDPAEYSHVTDQLAESRLQVERLEQEVTELRQFRESVDVIESAQFRARRKAGRPKNAEKVAA